MRRLHSSQPLYRLIYCSRRVACPPPGAPDPELEQIAATSRRRNDLIGVTGALLFTGAGFAQALEGSREALDRLFEQIAADPRHAEVTVLSFAPADRRRFPSNAMTVLAGLPSGMADPIDGLKPDPARDRPRLTTAGDILRLLEMMIRTEPAVAV
ncbi:MAG TPA: BLUF domain-containing protein [Rhodopila sp.]|uniref:BLUF domain-containing protein n=1 Tax=Rhodopila sp. TaxID=2480087 RepID=UPI002B9F7DD9|nr:BLUF domain-containing protein [Rhodopila sp.]HVY15685.1 BLUF domain-containing protein [Rhodopila sp.]